MLSFKIKEWSKEKGSKKGKYKTKSIKIEYDPEFEASVKLSNITQATRDYSEPMFTKLYQFQKEGVEYAVSKRGRCLIGDEMGVGKTIQAIAVSVLYRSDWPCVILCPASLKYNWKNEIVTWADDYVVESEVQVIETSGDRLYNTSKYIIVSYETAKKTIMLDKIKNCNSNIVIADEAHYLKSRDSIRSKTLIPFISSKKRVLLLSGTPALSKPVELWNLLQVIRPDLFKDFKPFGERYCGPKMSNFGTQRREYNGSENRMELNFVLRNVMIRRLKKEVLTELPSKNRMKRLIESDPKIIRQISQLKRSAGMDSSSFDRILSNYAKNLNEGGANKVLKSNDTQSIISKMYALAAEAKLPAVCKFLDTFLDYPKKFVVFGHHKKMLDGIEEHLKKNKQKYMRIDGSTSAKIRNSNVEKFQSDKSGIKFAVLSITACAEGLTLTASSTVIFTELFWTPAKLMQAEDRVHRISQVENVDIYYLIGKDTLDSSIFSKVKEKFETTSEIMDGLRMRKYEVKTSREPLLKYSEGSKSITNFFQVGKKEDLSNSGMAHSNQITQSKSGGYDGKKVSLGDDNGFKIDSRDESSNKEPINFSNFKKKERNSGISSYFEPNRPASSNTLKNNSNLNKERNNSSIQLRNRSTISVDSSRNSRISNNISFFNDKSKKTKERQSQGFSTIPKSDEETEKLEEELLRELLHSSSKKSSKVIIEEIDEDSLDKLILEYEKDQCSSTSKLNNTQKLKESHSSRKMDLESVTGSKKTNDITEIGDMPQGFEFDNLKRRKGFEFELKDSKFRKMAKKG